MRTLLGLSLVLALTSPSGAAELRVDIAAPFKPVDQLASGSLYGIAAEGWPADEWIAAVNPKNFTQMAPGGTHLPNGELMPVGDALIVAPIAARHGASVTIRMPDTFPAFPYAYEGDEDWLQRVDAMVRATVTANLPNIYAYEIWNEPDWTWKWGDFNRMWATTHAAIRAIDPERPIMGPSHSRWNAALMRDFLTAAKASGTLPEIVSWHELDPREVNDFAAHHAEYRALEAELGIGPLPISINEYGSPRDMAVPGALARQIARLERAAVDTANLAFWHKPGRLADLVAPKAGGPGPATDAEPNGAFWVYKWYGEMTGDMVMTIPESETGETLDGFAAYDPPAQTLRIVLGGEAGEHSVIVTGLEDYEESIEVQAYATHWTGTDGAMPAPVPLFRLTLPNIDGTIFVPIAAASDRDAYLLVLTPEGQGAAWTAPVPRFTVRLEAEAAEMQGARPLRIRMAPQNFFAPTVSGNAYVGLLDRDVVQLDFAVDVPAAGEYDLTLGYSSGLGSAAEYELVINGGESIPVSFHPTQFRELMDSLTTRVILPAGTSTITLRAGANAPRGVFAPQSLIEIDYLDVTEVVGG